MQNVNNSNELAGLKRVGWVVLALVGLALLWVGRPLFHGLVMATFVRGLGLTVGVLLTIALIVNAARIDRADYCKPLAERRSLLWPMVAAVAVTLLVVGAFTCYGTLLKRAVAQYANYNPAEMLVDASRPRLLPLEVAQRYGLDSIQESTVTVGGEWQPVLVDGKLTYVAPRVPQGDWRKLTDRPSGVVLVEAETAGRAVKTISQRMVYGEEMYLARDLRWQIWLREYAAELPEVFYLQYDGQWTACLPVVRYRGFFIRTPYFAGAWVVKADGSMKRLSRREAIDDQQIAASGRLYPETLARLTAEAYAYRHGIWNTWFGHRDQTEINDTDADGDGTANRQPYYRVTKLGGTWTTACEPYGRAFGLKVVIETNMEGVTTVYQVPVDPPLTGPAQAVGYVKSALPTYDWSTMRLTEPFPLVLNGRLTWRVAVTTTEAKGVNITALVDASTNQVLTAKTDAETIALLTGQRPASSVPATAEAGSSDALQLALQKLAEAQRALAEAQTELLKLQRPVR